MSAIAPPVLNAETANVSSSALENERTSAAFGARQDRRALRTATRPRTAWMGSWAGLAVFGALSAAAAVAGGLVTRKRRNKAWYRTLSKSSLTPPDRAFGIVWPVLYSLGALSAWRVARAPEAKARSTALTLWGTQLAFNGAWSPIFFGAHRPALAMATLAGNHASLGAYVLAARKVDTAAAWIVAPYLAWVTFAGVLNATIVAKNRGVVARAMARAADADWLARR